MITKQDVLDYYGSELKITAKIIRAIPEGKLDFKPSDKSNSVKDILKTLLVGHLMNQKFIVGETPEDSLAGVPDFDSIATAGELYDKMAAEFLGVLQTTSDEDIQQPFSMWGMDGTRATMLFALMFDMIHHRGQLSVYIRLLDGKLPSIYGPTSDEPMNS